MDLLAYINKFTIFGVDIYFYAIIILIGALVALFLSSFHAREKGYQWDFFSTIFLIALPSGIIGARLWYVIAQWEEFANNPIEIFNLRGGGLAIQGGVILGALAGIIVVATRRRGMDILLAADFAVPTILVAQAIGRWGNFFNQEVYGLSVDYNSWLLPTFIKDNMIINGEFKAPLFYLEGICNLGGYIVISRVLPTILNKHYKSGDITFSYFVYYGIVRLILEPVRDGKYNMGGEDNLRAVYMAVAFIVIGLLLIFINHYARYYVSKHPELKRNRK